MRFFERRVKPDEFKLAFEQGLLVGEMRSELSHLKATVAKLEAAQPAGQGLPALDSAVTAACSRLSRNDPALYRLLETQAKDLLAKGLPMERVLEQLELGHKGPRIVTEKKA